MGKSPGKEQKGPEQGTGGRAHSERQVQASAEDKRNQGVSGTRTTAAHTKCAHRIRTLWPLRNTSRVPAWLKVVLSVCEALRLPTYPHPTEGNPNGHDFRVAPFSGRIPSAVVGASSTARESRSMSGTEYLQPPQQWVHHPVLGKAAKASIQKRGLKQMGPDWGCGSGLRQNK